MKLKYMSLSIMSVILIFLVNIAMSSTFRSVDLNDLTALSSNIVIGKITGKRCQWASDSSIIYTIYNLQIDQNIKSPEEKSSIKFISLGGQIDSIGAKIIGVPEFEIDDNVFLFLGGNYDGYPLVMCWQQGAYRIDPDKSKVMDYHGNIVTAIENYTPLIIRTSDKAPQESVAAMEYHAFIDEVKSIIDGQSGMSYSGPYLESVDYYQEIYNNR